MTICETFIDTKAEKQEPILATRCSEPPKMRRRNGRTDGRTDGRKDAPMDRRTDTPSYRDARTHLKSQ